MAVILPRLFNSEFIILPILVGNINIKSFPNKFVQLEQVSRNCYSRYYRNGTWRHFPNITVFGGSFLMTILTWSKLKQRRVIIYICDDTYCKSLVKQAYSTWIIPAKFKRGPESMFWNLQIFTIYLFLWEKYFLKFSAS